MDAIELRYSRAAQARDLFLSFGIGMVLGSVVAAFLNERVVDMEPAHVFACWAGATAPAALVAGLWRWGRRGRVDADGVTYAESARGVVRHLAWGEIEDIHCIGREGVELRGAETRIRFSDDFAGLVPAWGAIGRLRGAELNAELRRRFEAGETLRFRGPDSSGVGWTKAAVLLVIVGPVLVGSGGWIVSALTSGRTGGDALGCSAFLLLVGVPITIALLLGIRGRCGWVELGPAGLTVQGSTRIECRWENLHSMGSSERYGLVFQAANGVRFGIPHNVANVGLLEELIRSRKER